jgi:hypothetical protein
VIVKNILYYRKIRLPSVEYILRGWPANSAKKGRFLVAHPLNAGNGASCPKGDNMKNFIIAFLFTAGILAPQTGRSAHLPPQEEAPQAVNLFYSDMSPYGEWIEFDAGLYAWHPYNVDPGWRPYTLGRWVWSNYGWFWVTAEPFGWATYHYGRWYFDDTYGWIWIPDTVWGPAWVEWRCNDDYIGWAPLPPYARFHVTVGIRFTRRWAAPLRYWSFISYDHFASNRPYQQFAPEQNTRRLISTTRSTGRYQIDQNRIIDQGVDRSVIQRRTSTRIGSFEVSEIPQRGVERVTSVGGQQRIEIYRPRPEDARTGNTRIVARRAGSRPSLDIDRVDRYQSFPHRDSRSSHDGNLRSQQGFALPGQPTHRSKDANRRQQGSEVERERILRSRPQFPSPRFDRATPNRSTDNKDRRPPDGRKRNRF